MISASLNLNEFIDSDTSQNHGVGFKVSTEGRTDYFLCRHPSQFPEKRTARPVVVLSLMIKKSYLQIPIRVTNRCSWRLVKTNDQLNDVIFITYHVFK